jgi:hypothetical protein
MMIWNKWGWFYKFSRRNERLFVAGAVFFDLAASANSIRRTPLLVERTATAVCVPIWPAHHLSPVGARRQPALKC